MTVSFSLFSSLSFAANTPSSGAVSSYQNKTVLDIQHWETSQGVPVYFVKTPEQIAMVDVNITFDAGSARDGEKFGLAQLTANLLDEGAGELTPDEIAEKFDHMGAIYDASVNQDMTSVGFRSLTDPQFLNPTVDTFLTVLTDPKFPDASFKRLKKQTLLGLEQMLQSPSAIAKKVFVDAIYGHQPYGHLVIGQEKTVSSITQQDVKDFYKKYYVVKNARIVMVGNLTQDAAKNMAEKMMAALPQGETPPPIAPMKPSEKPLQENIAFPSQQTTILMGQLGIEPNNPDYFPLMLGNYILGGSGLVSRLFEEVREQRGLVYQVNSGFSALAARGSFFIFLQTRKEETTHAVTLTQDILRRFVADGPTQKELESAKKNIIGGFPLQISSNADILGRLIYISFYKLPLNYLDTYRDKISSVTQKDIRDAFQRYIRPDEISIVTVGEHTTSSTNVAQSKETQ